MSASRRQSSGEDNILARLERDGKRGAAKSWKHMNTNVAWCGLASLAVIGLIAALASLAKENLALNGKPIVVEAKAPSDRYADAGGFAPLPAVGSPARRTATIVEEPAARPALRTAEAAQVPAMVMLKSAAAAKPAAGAQARPAAAAPVKAAAAAQARPATAAAVKLAAARIPLSRPGVKAAPVKPAPVKVAAAPGRATVAASPRPKKVVPAPAAARPEPAVDSDVALLSAIIMHASRHADERAKTEAQTCPTGKKCPVSKATD